MLTMKNRVFELLAMLLLVLWQPAVFATATNKSTSDTTAPVEHVPAGSPETGALIIIGIVAFLMFVAWIFARISDDSANRGGDRTLL